MSSSVFTWPDGRTVDQAVCRWAAAARESCAALKIGYFGSYARGDWGVGSDVDILVIVADSPEPFERRALELDATQLPVPADLLVYTLAEWERVKQRPAGRRLSAEVVWVRTE